MSNDRRLWLIKLEPDNNDNYEIHDESYLGWGEIPCFQVRVGNTLFAKDDDELELASFTLPPLQRLSCLLVQDHHKYLNRHGWICMLVGADDK